jgi:hypothetical protein
MKKSLSFILIFVVALTANSISAETFDANTWRGMQTYDVVALAKVVDSQIGKIVGVRCEFRSESLRHIKPNWYEAALWQHNSEERTGFSYIRVFIAKKDIPAFESMPSDFKSTATTIVYGQVQKDADANYVFVRLIGRKVTLDSAGNATVSW